MGIADALKNRPSNRLKEDLLESTIHESSFDYSLVEGISNSDIDELKNYEILAISKSKKILNSTIELGEILHSAREKLASYDKTQGKFMSWYESLGFNANMVSTAVSKYELCLEYPEQSEKIKELPERVMRALSNKTLKNNDTLKKETITKLFLNELKTSTEIKNYIILHSENRYLNQIPKISIKKLRKEKELLLKRLEEINTTLSILGLPL